MNAFLDSVGPYAPWLVFLLAAGESAAFLGLFIPGEAAVVFGGVLAGTGRVSLGWALAAAVLGAIVGDSAGYYLGSRYGVRILAVERFAKIARRIDQAGAIVTKRGWWALVVARFTSFLRAVVPFTAGMVRMRYRSFAIGNVTGGILWGLTFTLLGYFAGDRWPVVARWLRTGGLIILGLVVVVGCLFWVTRWVSRNQAKVVGWGHRVLAAPPLRWLVPGMRGPARMLRPYLRVWPAALAAVALLWMFGGLLQDVLKQEEFFLFDAATLRYAQQHQIGSIVDVAKALVLGTQPLVVGVAAVMLAAAFWRTRRAASLAILLSVGGQWVVVVLTRLLVDRIPPPMSPLLTIGGYGFPSEHLAALAALLTVALWPWRPTRWKTGVIRYGAAAVALALIGAGQTVLAHRVPIRHAGRVGGWHCLGAGGGGRSRWEAQGSNRSSNWTILSRVFGHSPSVLMESRLHRRRYFARCVRSCRPARKKAPKAVSQSNQADSSCIGHHQGKVNLVGSEPIVSFGFEIHVSDRRHCCNDPRLYLVYCRDYRGR